MNSSCPTPTGSVHATSPNHRQRARRPGLRHGDRPLRLHPAHAADGRDGPSTRPPAAEWAAANYVGYLIGALTASRFSGHPRRGLLLSLIGVAGGRQSRWLRSTGVAVPGLGAGLRAAAACSAPGRWSAPAAGASRSSPADRPARREPGSIPGSARASPSPVADMAWGSSEGGTGCGSNSELSPGSARCSSGHSRGDRRRTQRMHQRGWPQPPARRVGAAPRPCVLLRHVRSRLHRARDVPACHGARSCARPSGLRPDLASFRPRRDSRYGRRRPLASHTDLGNASGPWHRHDGARHRFADLSADPPRNRHLGGVFVGGTFMVATMAGLQLAREARPADPTPLLARMTASFATGQIAGPLLVRALGSGTEALVWTSASRPCRSSSPPCGYGATPRERLSATTPRRGHAGCRARRHPSSGCARSAGPPGHPDLHSAIEIERPGRLDGEAGDRPVGTDMNSSLLPVTP